MAESRHNVSVYATYELERENWGLTAGLGGSFEGNVEQQPGPDQREQSFYQGGLNFTFGAFSVGGVFEYYDNLLSFKGGDDADGWVAGGGLAYDFGEFVARCAIFAPSSRMSIAQAAAMTSSPWTGRW